MGLADCCGTDPFLSLASRDQLAGMSTRSLFKNLQPPQEEQAQTTAPPTESLPASSDANALQNRFDHVVYSSKVREFSLAASFQEAAGRLSAETGGVAVEARQLSFDFVAEIRMEDLFAFSRKTNQVAEGLEGPQRTRFTQQSSRMAMRFEMSMSVSAASLHGYAGGAAATAPRGELFDQFMDMTDDLLEQADDVLNEVFELLRGFLTGKSDGDDFASKMNNLMSRLSEIAGGMFQEMSGMNALPVGGGMPGAGAQFEQMEFNFHFSMSVSVESAQVQQSDPITFDLDGDGIELTSYLNGAQFDITGSGQVVQTAFVTGGDAFLAIDRNGNGKIDSGKELFGDQHGAANGFEELRAFDTNGDNVIDRRDTRFGELLLWRDNGNGKTEPGELVGLEEAGIAEISLRYVNTDRRAAGGNRIAQEAVFRRADGRTGKVVDSILNYIA